MTLDDLTFHEGQTITSCLLALAETANEQRREIESMRRGMKTLCAVVVALLPQGHCADFDKE